jgi:hypothetical protein
VSHEIAQEPLEALGSGQASAVESNGVGDQVPDQTVPAPVAGIDPDRPAAEDTTANVDLIPPRYDAQPGAQHDSRRSVVGLWFARRSRSQRVALVCLVAVIGLVVVLTGRDPRRYL